MPLTGRGGAVGHQSGGTPCEWLVDSAREMLEKTPGKDEFATLTSWGRVDPEPVGGGEGGLHSAAVPPLRPSRGGGGLPARQRTQGGVGRCAAVDCGAGEDHCGGNPAPLVGRAARVHPSRLYAPVVQAVGYRVRVAPVAISLAAEAPRCAAA